MAKLSDLVKESGAQINEEYGDEYSLIEDLETLIDMLRNGELSEVEIATLLDAVESISAAGGYEDYADYEDEDGDYDDYSYAESLSEATLNKMTPKELMAARKYRQKNKGKLVRQAKKRKMLLQKFSDKRKACAIKIAGKENLGCNDKGIPYRVKTRK